MRSTASRTEGDEVILRLRFAARLYWLRWKAMNYGSAEPGLGNPYDQKRVEINADRLFESWVEMKTPKSVQ